MNREELTPEEKEAYIKVVQMAAGESLMNTFYACGLKWGIETMFINEVNGDEFILTFKTVEEWKKHTSMLNQGEAPERTASQQVPDQGVAADPQITQDFKELNISLDGLCLQRGKDAGHSWIEFSDKFRAFEKRVLALSSEVERLRGEREAWNGEKRDLLDTLEELMSWQNGAPLPTYTKGWTAAMERAEALLTQNKQP
jgi:hypothetical protein